MLQEARDVPWGRQDWDAWVRRVEDGEPNAPSSRVATLRTILLRIPDRTEKTVAALGWRTNAELPFLAAHFARVLFVDPLPGPAARARAEGLDVEVVRREIDDLRPLRDSVDVALVIDALAAAPRGDFDAALREVRSCLVEGGLLVASCRALPRRLAAYPMRLGAAASSASRLGAHEVELQYRLRRAGFQGPRIRRLRREDASGERLLFIATRRANN